MYPQHHYRLPNEDDDDDLVTDSANVSAGDSGLGMHSRSRRLGADEDVGDEKQVLVSRDGKSHHHHHSYQQFQHQHITKFSPAAGTVYPISERVDSGFDSFNIRSSERFYSSDSNFGGLDFVNEGVPSSFTSSYHSTTSTTSDHMRSSTTSTASTSEYELKQEYGVCDSGLGLSEQCISTDSAIDVTEKFDRLNIGHIVVPSSEQRIPVVELQTTHRSIPLVCHSPPKPLPVQYTALTQNPNVQSVPAFRWIDAFEQDVDGDTTLHLAIIHELQKEVLNLIDHVPHPSYLNLQNNLLQTPLHLAVLTNQPKIVRKLVITGAALDMRDRRGNTALHIACQEGNLPCVEELLCPVTQSEISNTYYQQLQGYGRFPDLELRNYDGQNCVHLATKSRHIEILHLLRQYGAEINAQEGKSGRTALHYAVEAKNVYLVHFLIVECLADTNVQTFAGLTPIQLAYNHNESMVKHLMNLGARDVGPPPSDSESDSSSDEMTSMDTIDDDFLVNGEPLSSF